MNVKYFSSDNLSNFVKRNPNRFQILTFPIFCQVPFWNFEVYIELSLLPILWLK